MTFEEQAKMIMTSNPFDEPNPIDPQEQDPQDFYCDICGVVRDDCAGHDDRAAIKNTWAPIDQILGVEIEVNPGPTPIGQDRRFFAILSFDDGPGYEVFYKHQKSSKVYWTISPASTSRLLRALFKRGTPGAGQYDIAKTGKVGHYLVWPRTPDTMRFVRLNLWVDHFI